MLSKHTIFQSHFWEEFQNSLVNRKAGHITVEGKHLSWVIVPSVLKQSYLYINHGPEQGTISDFWPQLISIAKANHCTYIKFEPLQITDNELAKIKKLGFKKSNHSIQPETTLILDLTLEPEAILKQMKPKGRYNIKIAQKHGIRYQSFVKDTVGVDEALNQFYKLLSLTATRDHFGIHSREYYQQFLAKLYPHSRLYLAYHSQEVIAGIMAVFYQDESIYYYGASSNQGRETMAAYGLQWHVITEAKAQGATTYDFLGIAPENAPADHPWQGVTAFKKKFGGQVCNYPGTFHFICKPLAYFLIHAPKKILHTARKYQNR